MLCPGVMSHANSFWQQPSPEDAASLVARTHATRRRILSMRECCDHGKEPCALNLLPWQHVQVGDDHVVSFIPTPGMACNSRAVAWRSPHQLWASEKGAVKLWDLRNLQQSVCEYLTDDTFVHSLCAVREGVVAGTLRGSYSMAFAPDGALCPLTVRGMPREAAGSCVSVTAVPGEMADTTAVVTSFRRLHHWAGDDGPDGLEHHSVGILNHDADTAYRWSAGHQIHGFESVSTATRCASLRLHGYAAGGKGGVMMLCGGHEMGGTVRVWAAGPGADKVTHVGDLGPTGQHPVDKLHVRQVAMASNAPGCWTVAALRTRAFSTSDPSLSVYSVACV
jgi:hypothetical protein